MKIRVIKSIEGRIITLNFKENEDYDIIETNTEIIIKIKKY